MVCYYHPDREVVAQCKECGKFLCYECASKYRSCLCRDCAYTRVHRRMVTAIVVLILSAALFIGTWIYNSTPGTKNYGNMFGVVMFAAFPWGWFVLDTIVGTFIRGLGCFSVLLFGIELIIAYFIAPFVMLIGWIIAIVTIIRCIVLKRQIRNFQ